MVSLANYVFKAGAQVTEAVHIRQRLEVLLRQVQEVAGLRSHKLLLV
jgi:hypothetical protein